MNIKIISMLLFSLFLTNCNSQNVDKKEINNKNISKIEVIDFHSTRRCMTCNAIETSTKYTLNTFFEKEIKNGLITFQSINVDEENNHKIAEKFEASGTSLFVNSIIDGKEKIINLTEFAFMNIRNKDKFTEELKNILTSELGKL